MNDFDRFQRIDFVEEMLAAIEKDYGLKVERVAKCEEHRGYFTFSLIFSDYRLLEAKVQLHTLFNMPSIQIEGVYY